MNSEDCIVGALLVQGAQAARLSGRRGARGAKSGTSRFCARRQSGQNRQPPSRYNARQATVTHEDPASPSARLMSIGLMKREEDKEDDNSTSGRADELECIRERFWHA